MSQSRLIGFNGFAKSGKDTAADFAQAWVFRNDYTSSRHGFADKLKESAAHSLGVDEREIAWCNEIKADGVNIRISADYGANGWNRELSGREYLQFYGTEGHRDVFGSDFWVDALLPADVFGGDSLWRKSFADREGHIPKFCFITDVRFDNEAERIRELGGEIWRIERDGSGAGSAGKEGHASEEPLPGELINLVIDNNGSLEDLRDAVENAMRGVK